MHFFLDVSIKIVGYDIFVILHLHLVDTIYFSDIVSANNNVVLQLRYFIACRYVIYTQIRYFIKEDTILFSRLGYDYSTRYWYFFGSFACLCCENINVYDPDLHRKLWGGSY